MPDASTGTTPGLFAPDSDPPALLGTSCQGCGTVAFPAAAACAQCGASELTALPLPTRGVVWAWTTQEFAPPSPPYQPPAEGFQPFSLGFVDLDGVVRVKALLLADATTLEVGLTVELRLVPMGEDENGQPQTTFGFAPIS